MWAVPKIEFASGGGGGGAYTRLNKYREMKMYTPAS